MLNWLSFKASPEEFAELVVRPWVIPAQYWALAHWVALETDNALGREEIRNRLKRAYELVFATLPKKTQAAMIND